MKKSRMTTLVPFAVIGALVCFAPGSAAIADDDRSVLQSAHQVRAVASTVPANGDVNPYGVARVRHTEGGLIRGHVLVSNFNDRANLQGTGTTIVDVAPNGSTRLFSQIDPKTLPGPCPGGIGLTTALVVLRAGWVIVGSLPTTDGTSATAKAGCLIVLNSYGKPVETFAGPMINGPWDMTAADRGSEAAVFFTNVLNGTLAGRGQVVPRGTVVRLDIDVSLEKMPSARAIRVIASDLPERTDPSALVIGPTGLALGRGGCDWDEREDCVHSHDDEAQQVLYLADTLGNRIAMVSDPLHRQNSAGAGVTLTKDGSLNGPLGLSVAPNGNLLTVNAGDGFITEVTPRGMQIAKKLLDATGGPPRGAGTLFGLLTTREHRVVFVDDGNNTLNVLY